MGFKAKLQMKVKRAKLKGESHSYDHNRPKRAVVSRYK